ncbi:MAG TPA: hypothetical protein VHQ22_18685 [Terriglobales bacterium]|jgi:hypothetical protein|nr:hypothetical protein [Terriglobales bacterium]
MAGALSFSDTLAMSNNDSKPERSWQEIAADAAHEVDHKKLLELSKELEDALARRKTALRAKVKPESDKRAG